MGTGEAATGRLAVARALDVDRVTGEVVSAFAEAGVHTVLLKGPGLALWLYDDGAPRGYLDSDLLVAPAEIEVAAGILGALGFERQPVDCDHAYTWVRARGGGQVDLHWRIPGVLLPSADAWRVISGLTEPLGVGGVRTTVPRVSLRALIVALHAAHHGPEIERPLLDLERAIVRGSDTTWREATETAYRIGAMSAFSNGLRLVPQGARLAERLGLPSAELVEATVSPGSGIPLVFGVGRLAGRRGFRAKLRLLAEEAFPSPEFMRWRFPLARRGRVGLALAYPARIGWLLWHLGPSVRAWRRAHRSSESRV